MKVIVLEQPLEFELPNYDVAVQLVNHYTMGTPPSNLFIFNIMVLSKVEKLVVNEDKHLVLALCIKIR